MFKLTRRGFMVGCSAAIAGFTGGLSYTAFGSAAAEPNQEIIVVVFLRGGMDGLNLAPPIAGADRGFYEAKRQGIAVPVTGANAALPLNSLLGLHPAAAPLFDLYQSKHLAVVHAAGLTSDTRSHFDAMQYMELGTPGIKAGTTGWLTRHLQTAGSLPPEIIMPAVAAGNLQPASLLGSRESIGMTAPDDFNFNGHWYYGNMQRRGLRSMYSGASWLHQAGLQTLDAVDVVEQAAPGAYTPSNGAVYPGGAFGDSLQTVAQLIKMQLGLRVATVDLGGWDTHEYQGGSGGGYFASHVDDLAKGLAAFYTDLSNDGGVDHNKRITTVVMSEFGRSFEENASGGTDHGHGNVMLLLGGSVNGGLVYGDWPGLAPDQLYDHRDLAITTDYRRVLSEVLIRRLGNPNLGTIFPGYGGYAPAGIVQGADLTPIYTPAPTPSPTPGPTPELTPGPGGEHKLYIPAALRGEG